jgi:plasmid stabilization system protein ParE
MAGYRLTIRAEADVEAICYVRLDDGDLQVLRILGQRQDPGRHL